MIYKTIVEIRGRHNDFYTKYTDTIWAKDIDHLSNRYEEQLKKYNNDEWDYYIKIMVFDNDNNKKNIMDNSFTNAIEIRHLYYREIE